MEIKLKVNLTVRELYNFMLNHTYNNFSGYIGLLLSLSAVYALYSTWNTNIITNTYRIVLLITALLFTVIQPIILYLKSKKQIRISEQINKPLDYLFDESKILVSQGDDSIEYSYHEILKVKNSKLSIFIYVSKFNAIILPKTEFAQGDLKKLKELINKKATSARSINFGRLD
jgi:hypothetical protein